MNIKLIFPIILIHLLTASFSFARTNTLESSLESKSLQLPKSLQNKFEKIKKMSNSKFQIIDYINFPHNTCLNLERRQDNQGGKQKSTVRRQYVFQTTAMCLADPKTNWTTELIRELTPEWFRGLSSRLKSHLISYVYSNLFFNIHLNNKFDIENEIEKLTIQFLTISTLRIFNDEQKFANENEQAYVLTKELIFHESKSLNEIIEKTSQAQAVQKPATYARLKMIEKSNEAWFQRYRLVKNAKKSIRIQSYSLFDDLYGRAFVALLLQAIDRGVQVKMSLDGRGSILTSRSDLVELLAQKGARVSSYNPMFWSSLNLSKFFFAGPVKGFLSSNHDKILIVDDTQIMTGGRNIGNRYFMMNGESDHGMVYQDMDIVAEATSIPLSTILAFNVEFYSANAIDVSSILTRNEKYNSVFMALSTIESLMRNKPLTHEQITAHPEALKIKSLSSYLELNHQLTAELHEIDGLDKTSSLIDENTLTTEIFKLIQESQKTITIVNPYVILSADMKKQLVAAGQRGVEITILTTSPTSTDSRATQARLIDEWKSLLTDIPNLKLYGFIGPEKLHAKSFVFDSEISIIGSYNLDLLSEQLNSEFALKITSDQLSVELKEFIELLAAERSIQYNVENNIGPHSMPNGQSAYKKMAKLRFLSRIIRPLL